MTEKQWTAFVEYREWLKGKCQEWMAFAGELYPLQKAASQNDTPEYPLETAVVYNRAYDEVQPQDEIKLIVIGDNPGKDEQLAKNNRYLVGQSGKVAEGFFRKNKELNVDFRKNVIIMNKTPVHTAKTKHLKYLCKNGSDEIKNLIAQSQELMAQKAAELHQKLIEGKKKGDKNPELWIVGYSELKGKKIFSKYRDTLRQSYSEKYWENVYLYHHFSMNRFLVDLKEYLKKQDLPIEQALSEIGIQHRKEIYGE